MPLSFWCILAAGLLPYAATLIAKSRKGFDNSDPRAWLAHQEGFRARANAAQLNSFEAFPFFAAAVLVAHARAVPQHTIDLLAIAFVAARILYLAVYLANLAALRSLVWFAGLFCVVLLFFAG
ncbi:MAG TPA: MAPEG family protein [Steroidobacteraceae bacterium]|jgi:uncharacterized MAPEG superfamily protein